MIRLAFFLTLLIAAAPLHAQSTPVTLNVWDRTRTNATQFFAATPTAEQYGHVDSLLRISVQQRIRRIDWLAELSSNSELWLPNDAVSPVAAQHQLGLGGTYYAANADNRFPAAASFKQGFVRYHFPEDRATVRLGRFEFLDGAETAPADKTLLWVQTNRVAQRLIGNFGFSNGQRSLDGGEAHVTGTNWDVTAMGARVVQGVFRMNANPELNTDVQYLAFTRYASQKRVLLRGFAIGYHDGRTGAIKTDNRPLAIRQADHANIRIGSYGGSAIAALPAGKAKIDLMFWGVLQNGRWGKENHRAGAIAAEAGFQLPGASTQPWLRGGFVRTSGDNNPNDNTHNTYFQVLPTPRNYARFPIFNMMNLTEGFVQLVDKPTPKLDIRTDLHLLHLTSAQDLWYQGGGAFEPTGFGFVGRPSNNHTDFAKLYDISADYQLTPRLSLTAYYAHVWGDSVVSAIYPRTTSAQFGFLEMNYRFTKPFQQAVQK